MKHFSNRYIFIFSSIIVIAVATLLSLSATLLQPAQERNLEIEKKKSMLESIGVPATRDNTVELYDEYIKESFVLNYKGEPVGGIDAFKVVLKNEQKKSLDQQYLPVFRAAPDDGEKVIILPVEGKGLWGPIYGYVSLRSDLNTIYGVTFDHKGETPGLGAEINTTPFESMFIGKKLFDIEKFI
jgi:Na+-transporting NADH:ubiquinone oxidoreductase subunit C